MRCEPKSPRSVAAVQAAYYVASGVWPLVSMRTFERVTGAKTDTWLVNTVGLLVAAIGAGLGLAAARDRVTGEMAMMATSSAAALTAVDVYYVAKGRISSIYLADAIAELGLMAWWMMGLSRRAAADRITA